MTGAQGPAAVQSHLCPACPWGTQHVWCASACLCFTASVVLTAARFMVNVVGADNSIREETDLEAEWRRRREMTAWSSSDQHCLVMTLWYVLQGHTKQTLIALHHLSLFCSLLSCRLSLWPLQKGGRLSSCAVVCLFFFFLCLCQCFRTGMILGLQRRFLTFSITSNPVLIWLFLLWLQDKPKSQNEEKTRLIFTIYQHIFADIQSFSHIDVA